MAQHDQNNRLYSFPAERGKGVLGTALFHIALVAVLIYAGITSTKPETEQGLLVNFGIDDSGSGMIEPSRSSAMESAPLPEPSSLPVAATQENAIETQEHDEEAPEIKKVVQQPDPEAERKKQEAIEAEKKRLADIEAERIRREQEEAEKKRLEEEARKVQEALDRTKNALAAGKNTGTTTTGEGATAGTGNQGVTSGSIDTKVRGEGTGIGDGGISFSLAGRKQLELPKPVYNLQAEGTVVVEITVDRTGKVISATPGVKGSTTLDENLLKIAREAALKAKFDEKPDAPLQQRGTITYIFILK